MAQLVARFHGMEEVRGSNPLSSTHTLWAPPFSEGPNVFWALIARRGPQGV